MSSSSKPTKRVHPATPPKAPAAPATTPPDKKRGKDSVTEMATEEEAPNVHEHWGTILIPHSYGRSFSAVAIHVVSPRNSHNPPLGCPRSQENPDNEEQDEEQSLYILLTPERDAHKNTVRAGECMVAYAKKAAQYNLNIMLYQGCHAEYKNGAKCFAIYPFQSDVKKFASHCPLLEVEDATLQPIKFTATVEDAFAEDDQALPVAQDKWIHIIA